MTNQANEGITCAAGAVTSDGGPITVAVLWKPATFAAMGLVTALNGSSAAVWNVNPFSDAVLYFGTNTDFASASPTVYNPSGLPWRLDVWTKPDGNSTARYHEYRFDTTTWAHTDKAATTDGNNGPVASILLGKLDADESLNGLLGAVGVWNTELSDGNIETLEDTLQHWMDLSPAALWKFNTDDVAGGAVDLTGNGADETSHSGTSFSATEPSPFNYALSGGGYVPRGEFLAFFC